MDHGASSHAGAAPTGRPKRRRPSPVISTNLGTASRSTLHATHHRRYATRTGRRKRLPGAGRSRHGVSGKRRGSAASTSGGGGANDDGCCDCCFATFKRAKALVMSWQRMYPEPSCLRVRAVEKSKCALRLRCVASLCNGTGWMRRIMSHHRSKPSPASPMGSR